MSKNERLDALIILTKLLDKQVSLSQPMSSQPALSPFSKTLCFGICRHHHTLTHLADQLIKKRPKCTEIWLVILMGLYQLHYLNKPEYAVVKESVELVATLKKTWAKGLVNAVLRTYCRQKDHLTPFSNHDVETRYNHPRWLIQQLQQSWPEDWQAILQANQEHPPMTLRVNQLKTTTKQYLQQLKQAGIQAQPHPYAPFALILEQAQDVNHLPGFSTGDVSVQDAAAQLAAPLLDLKSGLRVLDACCAPGGKTGHILETEPNLSDCLALDLDEKRLLRVRENLSRLHLQATLKTADAATPTVWWDKQPFDRILLDAPCSATGVIRRHPDIKLLRHPKEIHTIQAVQRTLLNALWPLLAIHGRLVYATCSILPEENDEQIKQFLADHNDCELIKLDVPWGRFTGHGWQIFPGEHAMDGFFYSVLQKLSS